MGLMHRIHWKSASTWFEAMEQFLKIESSWTEAKVRLDRIIFPNLGITRQFLMELPSTIWCLENRQKPVLCQGKCMDSAEIMESLNASNLSQIQISPAFICSINTAYLLPSLLNVLQSAKKTIKLEILCQDHEKELEDLQYFLQDKSHELGLIEAPRFSLVEPEYEIQMIENVRSKKRNRKPSQAFQRLLKKSKPDWYPHLLGNEYYGQKVFLSFVHLHQTRTINHLKALYPPSPMKYYDLQLEGMIELRFTELIPFNVFKEWIRHLKKVMTQYETSPVMFRASFFLDAWNLENYHKNSRQDRFYFSWNDFELAFSQQDFDDILLQSSLGINSNNTTIYFELTPIIEDIDPRVQKLHQITQSDIDLK